MIPLIFAILGCIKGGSHWNIPKLKELDHGVLGFLIDGTRLTTLIVTIWMVWAAGPVGFLIGLAWFLGIASSMGEEAGASGTYKEWWGPYKNFGRSYGIKKALQRGIYQGALLTLVTGYTPFIVAGATFPICYFVGQSLYTLIHNKNSTAYAEPVFYGVIGVAFSFYLETL